jgi:hypothetical protein
LIDDCVFFGVAFGYGERRGRDIKGDEAGLRQFFSEGNGDAAGACADVGDHEAGAVVFVGTACAEFAEGEAVECDFDEMLGFGAGDENVGSNFEGKAPELLFAGEVLYRDAGDAAIEKSLVGVYFFRGELGFGMGVEIGAFALGGVEEQQLRRESVGGDVSGAELGDAVFEGGAEVHGKSFKL